MFRNLMRVLNYAINLKFRMLILISYIRLKRQACCVQPAMTYGADTWTVTKQAHNRLAIAYQHGQKHAQLSTWHTRTVGSTSGVLREIDKDRRRGRDGWTEGGGRGREGRRER